ncbi:hypothetical protein E8E12_000880 [Didymella heteroderae]|uniref:Uncharacterized protein n=1 Tax=Didymella heteroderae TaxID=1769908 RepID=A0A9P5BUF6_9PLEO|nr:hypothetical protein E8E12_000880 [Didymella heteroderae]
MAASPFLDGIACALDPAATYGPHDIATSRMNGADLYGTDRSVLYSTDDTATFRTYDGAMHRTYDTAMYMTYDTAMHTTYDTALCRPDGADVYRPNVADVYRPNVADVGWLDNVVHDTASMFCSTALDTHSTLVDASNKPASIAFDCPAPGVYDGAATCTDEIEMTWPTASPSLNAESVNITNTLDRDSTRDLMSPEELQSLVQRIEYGSNATK